MRGGFRAKAQPGFQRVFCSRRQVVLHFADLIGMVPAVEQERGQIEFDRMDCRQSERRACQRFAGSALLKEQVCRLAVFFRQLVKLLRGCKLTGIFAFFDRHLRDLKMQRDKLRGVTSIASRISSLRYSTSLPAMFACSRAVGQKAVGRLTIATAR
ncbi:hypothetical protein X742_01600 [Mesorhizobium sp. LNHC232B00]|nr:hypothetical protein X742_01600 [Mesorhizobium sp. LNHC232B00]